MKTITRWSKDEEFESLQDHNLIKLDGNRKNGFSPKALLLSGLAACSGIDIVEILRKMKIDVNNFEIEVEADQTDELPRVFKDIQITYRISCEPKDEIKIRKAIDLSLDKYCGVSAMLKKNSKIIYSLVVD